MLKAMLERLVAWSKSAAGITVLLSVVLAILAAVDRGPYVLVNTVVSGGMLALMAIGLALVFGVMNIPLFAHGEFFMIGSLVAYFVFTPIHNYVLEHPNAALSLVAPLIGMLCAAVAGLVVGALVERLIFFELRKRSRANWVMNTFLLTLGLSVVLINGHQLVFGTEFKGITGYWGGMPLSIMDVFISRDRVMAFVIAVVLIVGFWVFMKATRTGRAIRAVAQDETGALMVGIGLNGIQMLTMALACALATVSGASLLFMYPSYPSVGLEPLYMAWFVVILVGLGNTLGALAGGFMVALLKSLTVEYVGSGWDFVVPSALIILVLIFKPNGIFGSEVRSVHET
jgi:branched-chain amino acid transport system permease protein